MNFGESDTSPCAIVHRWRHDHEVKLPLGPRQNNLAPALSFLSYFPAKIIIRFGAGKFCEEAKYSVH